MSPRSMWMWILALAKVGIEPGIRAEKLTIAQMVELADALVNEKIVKK